MKECKRENQGRKCLSTSSKRLTRWFTIRRLEHTVSFAVYVPVCVSLRISV